MSKLEPALEAIRVKYELLEDDFWPLPMKKGTWLVKHKALEKVSAIAGISFEPPMIIEANSMDKVAVVVVTGHLDKRSEWSFGEASSGNNKNAYPFAMAEKRAKDRVILKLVGIHGLVYSEDEIDQPSEHNPEAYETKKDGTLKNAKGFTDGAMNSAGKRRALDDIVADMSDVHSNVTLDKLYRAWEPTLKLWSKPGNDDEVESNWHSIAMEMFRAKRKELNQSTLEAM